MLSCQLGSSEIMLSNTEGSQVPSLVNTTWSSVEDSVEHAGEPIRLLATTELGITRRVFTCKVT